MSAVQRVHWCERSHRIIVWRSQLLSKRTAEHLPLLQVQSERQRARPMEPLPSATDLRGSPRTGGPSSSKQSTARAPLTDRKTSNRKSATNAKPAQFLTAIDRLGDRVEVEIVNTGGPTSKRLTLSRSSQKGKPVAIPLKAWQLLRAASLELTRWQWHSNSRRLACADERVLYVCESIALPFDFTLPADAVEIDSVSGSPALV